MKHIPILLGALLITTSFTRCSKEDTPPQAQGLHSYWMVNKDTVAYSNIIVNTAPLLSELRVNGPLSPETSLSFAFRMAGLPHSGTYKVDYVASDPSTMCNVYVTYRDTIYDVNPAHNTTTVGVSLLPSGKGRYVLEPTWFYKQLNPSDSILVQGAITAP